MSNVDLIQSEELHQEPIERAQTIPSEWYTNPEVLKFEQEAIFSKYWQFACHECELPDQGDMMTLEVAENPILVVRDQEDQLRAFYNVCKHRGGPVAVKKGTTSVLQCQYHGWTYLLDGSLRGVPQFKKVDLFDKKDFGLEPVALKIWQGLVFIKLSNKNENLNKYLEGITSRISPIDLSTFQYHSTETYIIDCNWKVYVDNFLEGYHIPIVHPELAKLLDYRDYVTETSDWYSLQHSPFQNGSDNIYGVEEGEAYYYFIFPNIMLNIVPGRLQTNVIRPVSENKTKVVFNYYYQDLETAEKKGMIEEDKAYSDEIQQEDVEICELVQKGLGSKAYNKGRFSVKRELGVYHFQSLLKKVFKEHLS